MKKEKWRDTLNRRGKEKWEKKGRWERGMKGGAIKQRMWEIKKEERKRRMKREDEETRRRGGRRGKLGGDEKINEKRNRCVNTG